MSGFEDEFEVIGVDGGAQQVAFDAAPAGVVAAQEAHGRPSCGRQILRRMPGARAEHSVQPVLHAPVAAHGFGNLLRVRLQAAQVVASFHQLLFNILYRLLLRFGIIDDVSFKLRDRGGETRAAERHMINVQALLSFHPSLHDAI